MLTVILAAGSSERFYKAGYSLPKPALPGPKKKTVLEIQVDDMLIPDEFLFVSQKSQFNYLHPILMKLQTPRDIWHRWLPGQTAGPLDTAWEVRGILDRDEPLLIAYCDVVCNTHLITALIKIVNTQAYESAIVGVKSESERFQPIPGHADVVCGGLYYFESGSAFVAAMANLPKGADNGIPDVVFSMNYGIVYAHNRAKHWKYVDIGTPEDYLTWIKNYSKNG